MAQNIGLSLPFSPRWVYRPYNVGSFVLPPGTSRKICEIRKNGYVLLAGCSLDDLLVEAHLELETGEDLYEAAFNTGMLLAGGLTRPQCQGWWVSNNLPLVPLFVVQFTPAQWYPFYRMFRFSIQNPATNPRSATINQVNVLAIEFKEPT